MHAGKTRSTLAADAPAPCIARWSATMVLAMQDKQTLVFHEEEFQLPVLFQCQDTIDSEILIYFDVS